MNSLEKLKAHIRASEGLKLLVYKCPSGFNTIGYGTNLDCGITMHQAEALMCAEIDDLIEKIPSVVPFWDELDDARKMCLIDMAYNMGLSGLSKFHNTLDALQDGDYTAAAAGIRASKYYTQTGNRAKKIAKIIETGEWL
jgi:lysozyme